LHIFAESPRRFAAAIVCHAGYVLFFDATAERRNAAAVSRFRRRFSLAPPLRFSLFPSFAACLPDIFRRLITLAGCRF
jgi:hypothetical protein